MIRPTNLEVITPYDILPNNIPRHIEDIIWDDEEWRDGERPFEIVHDFGVKVLSDKGSAKAMTCIKYHIAVMKAGEGVLIVELNEVS